MFYELGESVFEQAVGDVKGTMEEEQLQGDSEAMCDELGESVVGRAGLEAKFKAIPPFPRLEGEDTGYTRALAPASPTPASPTCCGPSSGHRARAPQTAREPQPRTARSYQRRCGRGTSWADVGRGRLRFRLEIQFSNVSAGG